MDSGDGFAKRCGGGTAGLSRGMAAGRMALRTTLVYAHHGKGAANGSNEGADNHLA
jgi:hypothetical protein